MFISDPEFNRLTWQRIKSIQSDPEALDQLLEGCTVTGAETIEWPINSGLLLHLQRPTGERFTIDVTTVYGDSLVFRHGVDSASKGEATA